MHFARQVRRLGLSHSEIHGSKVICTSPWLVAAYHVLHRLNEPRHPPFALIYFLSSSLKVIADIGDAAHTFSCIVYRLSLCETCLNRFRSKNEREPFLQFCLCQYVKDLFLSEEWEVKSDESGTQPMYSFFFLRSSFYMWRISDSNRRPLACEASALAS